MIVTCPAPALIAVDVRSKSTAEIDKSVPEVEIVPAPDKVKVPVADRLELLNVLVPPLTVKVSIPIVPEELKVFVPELRVVVPVTL